MLWQISRLHCGRKFSELNNIENNYLFKQTFLLPDFNNVKSFLMEIQLLDKPNNDG